jgi:hypothetical protein
MSDIAKLIRAGVSLRDAKTHAARAKRKKVEVAEVVIVEDEPTESPE